MTNRYLILAVLSLFMSITVIVAQDACTDTVNEALTATDAVCSGIGRNEACYGNINIQAVLADESLVFEYQGDVVDLTEIERLTLSPYDEETLTWGVALLNVQANIPDTVPGQGVTFLLYGDVDIENAGDAMEAFYFSSGVGTAGCNEAQSGIIINTPEGVGTISLIANDVTIELGSTAVLTAQPDDLMTIALTEGNATVTAEGESQSFEGGFQVTVPVDENLQAAGVPSEPEPISEDDTETLPDVTQFIEDTDDDSDDSDADDSESSDDTETAGGNIVPLSGVWTSTVTTTTIGDGCPPGMGDMMAPSFNSESVDFGDTFDLESFVSLMTAEGTLPGMVYSNPAPNVYTMEFSAEGSTMTWTTTILSETSIEGNYEMNMASPGFSCTINFQFMSELSG